MSSEEFNEIFFLTGRVARTTFACSQSKEQKKRYEDTLNRDSKTIGFFDFGHLCAGRRAELNDDEVFFKCITLCPRDLDEDPRYKELSLGLPEEVGHYQFKPAISKMIDGVANQYSRRFPFM
jgi:hypothetical protein